LDAAHFRQRAAHAREMAQSGEDFRLAVMLLDVAIDLDAEAEAIEAEAAQQRHRPNWAGLQAATLHSAPANGDGIPVQFVDTTSGGATLGSACPQASQRD
jgi:hypothetical protein